jgi:DNA-binding response OmpR family regulator
VPSILVRRIGDAVVVTVDGDGRALAAEIRDAHAGAQVDVTVLSINEACADRMRALEEA